MKITQFLTRLVLMVFVCGLVVFANISPASAAWGRASSPDKGVEPLPKITELTEKAANSNPYEINDNPAGLNSSKVNKGLNEVQGTADIDRMKRDNFGDKLPVVREAEKAADKVDNKLKSVKKDAERAADKVDNKLKSVKKDAENNANSVLDQASDVVSDVKNKAGEAFNSLTGKAEDTAKSIKEKVKS